MTVINLYLVQTDEENVDENAFLYYENANSDHSKLPYRILQVPVRLRIKQAIAVTAFWKHDQNSTWSIQCRYKLQMFINETT